jgi:hypothetical protein
LSTTESKYENNIDTIKFKYESENENLKSQLEGVKREKDSLKSKLKKYYNMNKELEQKITILGSKNCNSDTLSTLSQTNDYEVLFKEKCLEIDKIESKFEEISEKFFIILEKLKLSQTDFIEDIKRLKELIIFILQSFNENQHDALNFIINYIKENDTFIGKVDFSDTSLKMEKYLFNSNNGKTYDSNKIASDFLSNFNSNISTGKQSPSVVHKTNLNVVNVNNNMNYSIVLNKCNKKEPSELKLPNGNGGGSKQMKFKEIKFLSDPVIDQNSFFKNNNFPKKSFSKKSLCKDEGKKIIRELSYAEMVCLLIYL